MKIKTFADPDRMALSAAHLIREIAANSVSQQDVFRIALSGGNTPRATYACLSRAPFRREFPWKHTHVYWGDERCVPPDHPQSNYRSAFEAFLSTVPIPGGNIHRMPAEKHPGSKAAEDYEEILLRTFSPPNARSPSRTGKNAPVTPVPAFDLILLGLGRDGHTASLFPGDPALFETARLVRSVRAPDTVPPPHRLTFSLHLINRAKHVLFLVAGKGKKEVLNFLLKQPGETAVPYPAGHVCPTGTLTWYVRTESLE